MIILRDIVKRYKSRTGSHTVLNRVNLVVRPGERLGVLGQNGSGKSTLIRIISGQEHPNSGEVRLDMNVSWPLAFSGGFQGSLTGYDNLRFIARIYDVEYTAIRNFVEEFSELGKYFWEPVKTYSSGMQARLAFALSLAIEFDCYLIDEIIAVGDARFHERCTHELFEKRRDRAFIIASHDPEFIRKYCTRAAVLHRGTLARFESVDDAFGYYMEDVLQLRGART